MAYMIVRHNVEDYDRWKPYYDEHGSMRKAGGSMGSHVFRSAGDPSEVVILFQWDSLENARRFAQSDDLREVMQRAGVTGKPDIYFLDEVDQTSA